MVQVSKAGPLSRAHPKSSLATPPVNMDHRLLEDVDPFDPDVISISEACRQLPGNVSPATISRWRYEGLHGYRLPTIKIGRRIYTTPNALKTFLRVTQDAQLRGRLVSPSTDIDDDPAAESAADLEALAAAEGI